MRLACYLMLSRETVSMNERKPRSDQQIEHELRVDRRSGAQRASFPSAWRDGAPNGPAADATNIGSDMTPTRRPGRYCAA